MIALKQGNAVSGSDMVWSGYMDALKDAGALLYIGHSEWNLRRNGDVSSLPDAVVVSSAIPPENVEVLIAKSCGVPVYKRGAWLGKITKDYNLIAVSGSHASVACMIWYSCAKNQHGFFVHKGKSTTTSMLAYILKAMGDDLTAVIGAQVPQFAGSNVIYGNGHNFVLEADEYDACFLGLSPHIAIVTNVDWEHVDIFQDEEAVKTVFRKFLGQIRNDGHLILYGDTNILDILHDQNLSAFSLLNNPKEASVVSGGVESLTAHLCRNRCKVTTFGMSSYNDWQATSVSSNSQGGCDYKLYHKGQHVNYISLQIPGVHNVLNSLAVVAALSGILGGERQLYESIDMVKSHLQNFIGVSRRFELIGEIHGYHIFDDYAHHPTEVSAVLQTAKTMHPSKELFVVFQPHTYRFVFTLPLCLQFVYLSVRGFLLSGGVCSRLAAMKSQFASAFTEADKVVITEDNVVDKLVNMISEDPSHQMVILTLGAGNITTVGRKLIHELQRTLK
ncbi:hypothetical protein BUALT_Bualt06G0104100 [Buddleja alternifolia]|uniref:UDP-N-acetylmuramate--L-alanine ligase n=1 Tax=Buddleja alternifolia TaxID=168488 RepID=A0AAV6XEA3_9LAMI|nr:hypothetical protein BUALT_Bualt06G0104100 [Buddleja alternifolia]